MAHQVNSIDYGDYRYKVGDLIKISSSHEYLYLATTGSSRTNCPNISKDTRKITQIWASDANLSVSNPIVTAYYSGSYRYGGGAIRPEQIAVGSGGQKIKHYVRFNANGGSGAPGTQTKVYGSVLTISSTRPTRSGYSFSTWNTNSNGTGTNYSPGQQYGVDADLTLYAIWRASTYTVSYNANGGSGAPMAQTKTHGVNLTLSNVRPTRTGYTFQGWATSSGGGVSYSPGSSYTSNSSITLYAVWRANTYTVSYNANGGSGAPGAQYKTHDVNLTLSNTKPTRTNYVFKGWGTSAYSTSVSYNPGAIYSSNSDITLYAIWELAYTSPRITNLTVDRCLSDGTLSEEGTYAKIQCNWSTDKTVSKIIFWHKKATDGSWSSVNGSGSGTSGTINSIIGGSFSTEFVYNICVEVQDAMGKTELYRDIAAMSYIIDIPARGDGIAFGKPADTEGVMDVNYDLLIRKNLKKDVNGTIVTPFTFWKSGVEIMKSLWVKERIIKESALGTSWIQARNSAMIAMTGTAKSDGAFYPLLSTKTQNGSWNIGVLNENLAFSYDRDSDYTDNNNTSTVRWLYTDGTMNNREGYMVEEEYIKDAPLSGSWGEQFAFNGWDGSHDKYFLGVNSNGEVHSGTQLNGANNITVRKLAFHDSIKSKTVVVNPGGNDYVKFSSSSAGTPVFAVMNGDIAAYGGLISSEFRNGGEIRARLSYKRTGAIRINYVEFNSY